MKLCVPHKPAFAALVLSIFISACSTLPSAGPTANQVIRPAEDEGAGAGFVVKDLDLALSRTLAVETKAQLTSGLPFDGLVGGGATDLIGPGDVLNVQIYEVGVSLFGGSNASTAATEADVASPKAHGENFSGLMVDRNGEIHLPYIGNVSVQGKTPLDVSQEITRRFRSTSQSPQALVKISENLTNSVYVTGAAAKPGKYDLSPGGTRLLDIVALAGGVNGAPEDLTVTLIRRGKALEQRLSAVTPGTASDIQLQPGDRVQFNKRPRTFTVFGYAGKVSQVSFPSNELSLAEAIAQAAGPNDSSADATAVFLFRNIPDPANPDMPQRTIYRLNLMQPQSYFVAQDVKMEDKDLIYVASARSNQANKFIALIGQLFSPVLTARALTR